MGFQRLRFSIGYGNGSLCHLLGLRNVNDPDACSRWVLVPSGERAH
jgi:hypothetical protein